MRPGTWRGLIGSFHSRDHILLDSPSYDKHMFALVGDKRASRHAGLGAQTRVSDVGVAVCWMQSADGCGLEAAVGEILTWGLLGCLPWVLRLSPMAETSTRLLGLAELCQTVGDRWLGFTGLPVEANACVFAARVLKVVAEQQKVPFVAMACTTSIHTDLPDVDNPPAVLDPAALSVVEPGVWPWHIVVFLGTGFDAWVLDLTAGQFGSVWPVHAKPGPVVPGLRRSV